MGYAKRKTIRSTAAQVKLLVEYMAANPHFAVNDFSGPLEAKQSNRKWEALADTLATHGPRKTVDQWKHTWRDLKKRAREEASIFEQLRNAAGNNIPVTEISNQARKILDTIGHEFASGNESGKKTVQVDCSSGSILPQDSRQQLKHLSKQPEDSDTTTSKPSRSTGRASTSSNYKASWFIRTQEQTNVILEELSKELKRSNELRMQQLSILQSIADRLESRGVSDCM